MEVDEQPNTTTPPHPWFLVGTSQSWCVGTRVSGKIRSPTVLICTIAGEQSTFLNIWEDYAEYQSTKIIIIKLIK